MIEKLLKDIVVCKDTTDYNFCNILKGVANDTKWLQNRYMLRERNDTILGIYFNHALCVNNIDQPGYNPGVLRKSIEDYIYKYKPKLPEDHETCVYLRVGDRTHVEFDYIRELQSSYDTITIVCSLCYSGENPDNIKWKYSSTRVYNDLEIVKNVIADIMTTYPEKMIQVYSNSNPDLDICYLYKNGFISDPKCSWKKIFGNF